MPGARDGQLKVNRGTDSPPWALQMFDDELGLWLTLAQADVIGDAMAQGIPVLRGPYVVDYTDIPHELDTKTLWTPAAGDVLLRLFTDWQTVVQWDHGWLMIGQNLDGSLASVPGLIALGLIGVIARTNDGALDNVLEAVSGETRDHASPAQQVYSTATVFQTTDPVQVQLAQTAGSDPGSGHVELYALVARAIAP